MNFVYFMPDEMRADSVSAYGNSVVKMPNSDKLASQGTVFEQCHIQNPVCSPSRCSIFTGLYPHNSGHRTLWHLIQKHEMSLFGYLHENGYQIAWYGKNDLYSKECIDEYVDDIYCKMGPHTGESPHKEDEPGFLDFLKGPCGSLEETGDGICVEKAVEFIRNWKEGDKPFFLYLPLTMPHPPYSAPEPYHDMYDPASLSPLKPKVTDAKPSYFRLIPQYRDLAGLLEDEFLKIKAVYLGMNSAVDALLGKVMDALEASGRDDDTALIFSADHGDWAGDYGLVEKWPNAFDEDMTHIPLIIRMPGGVKGHRVRTLTEAFDIFSTVMELAGIEERHTNFSRSLVPELNGGEGDPERVVYAEGGYDVHERHAFEGYPGRTGGRIPPKSSPFYLYYPKSKEQQEAPESVCRATMVRTQRYKLVYRREEVSELYDLEKDPDELVNLYGKLEMKDVQDDLTGKMLGWLQHTSDTVPYKEDSRWY